MPLRLGLNSKTDGKVCKGFYIQFSMSTKCLPSKKKFY